MTIPIKSHLPFMYLSQKRIFLRADLNVALVDGKVVEPFRLQAILPTINLILSKGGLILLATHIGRPVGIEPSLSTYALMPFFEQAGYTIAFAPSIEAAQKLIDSKAYQIVLLENLRFWPQEYAPHLLFAHQLRKLTDIYVNDAFATLHRNNSSLTLLPTLFLPQERTIGLLVERELKALNYLTDKPEQPFLLIMGGGKVEDKLPCIEALLPKISKVLLCPAMVFTFLQALDKPVGRSLVAHKLIDLARKILIQAQEQNKDMLFPEDYLVAEKTFDGTLSTVSAEKFPADAVGIAIGPLTVERYKKEIAQAKTIFFNAAMVNMHKFNETSSALKSLLVAIAESNAYSVIGGGESVAAAKIFKVTDQISYCSTGGGATLALLSGQELPGLVPFI